jgi:hypothetical protein
VLDVTAGTLELDGALSADGEDANGPNAEDPTPFSDGGGAGAGGSVLVHAERLSGAGVVGANGGWACLTGGPPLLPEGNTCNSSGGSGGGGGGGLVAVYATSCEWTGALQASGGIDQGAEGEDIAQTTGQDGSAEFFAEGGSCAEPSKEGGGGPPGPGQSGGGATQSGAGNVPGPGASTTSLRPTLSGLKLLAGKLTLHVSAPATITLQFARCEPKRVKAHGKYRKRTVCKMVRRLSVRAKRAGSVSIRLPAGLAPGTYRMTVRATDTAGKQAKPLVANVTVHKRKVKKRRQR